MTEIGVTWILGMWLSGDKKRLKEIKSRKVEVEAVIIVLVTKMYFK